MNENLELLIKDVYAGLELLPSDLQGWNGNDIIFEEMIVKTRPKLIIEVGTWKGQSAINMGKLIKLYNLDCKIICIDTWLGSLEFIDDTSQERNLHKRNGYPTIYYQFLSNVVHNDLQDVIIPLPIDSRNAFRYLQKIKIKADLIYIDGSHEYNDIYDDVNNYYKLLTDKGVIFGDDYNKAEWIDVVTAINTYCNQNYKILKVKGRFWIIKN